MYIQKKIFINVIISLTVGILFFFSPFKIFEIQPYKKIEILVKPVNLLQIDNMGIIQNTQIIDRADFIDKFTKNVLFHKKCNVKLISNKKVVINDYYLGIEKKDVELLQINLKQDAVDCSNDVKAIVEKTQQDIINGYKQKISLFLRNERFIGKDINRFIFIDLQLEKIGDTIKDYSSINENIIEPKIDKYGLSFLVFLISVLLMSCFGFYKNSFNGSQARKN